MRHWTDPQQRTSCEVNHHDGGPAAYFCNPSGHYVELITVASGGRLE